MPMPDSARIVRNRMINENRMIRFSREFFMNKRMAPLADLKIVRENLNIQLWADDN